jgi:hypothetical protein
MYWYAALRFWTFMSDEMAVFMQVGLDSLLLASLFLEKPQGGREAGLWRSAPEISFNADLLGFG